MGIVKLIVSVVACLLAGFIGSLFTAPAIPAWYSGLVKPPFNPPSWIFAPVWTTLYILMAIAAFLIWQKGLDKGGVKAALALFALQLVLNAVWSILFFGLRSPLAGLADILALLAVLILTIISFFNISKIAGALLLPYLFWVSFATVLNFSIFILNLK